MALTVLPLAVSAVAGYVMLSRGVIAEFAEVTDRQRDQLAPTHHLQILLSETIRAIETYIATGNPISIDYYSDLRKRSEVAFARLHERLQSEPTLLPLLAHAHDEWASANRVGDTIVSVGRPASDQESLDLLDVFHDRVAVAVHTLTQVYNELELEIDVSHTEALRAYQRTQWLAGVAGLASALAMITGVAVIGRFLLRSVDRLIDGAARFAAGDREHRIEIHVPPELRRVATEFNRMIVRIQDTEAALAERAQRDGLTGLLNRRAFDEALTEALSRRRRLNEPFALVMFDLDHFKRINDTYGHGCGDEVLRAVARTARGNIRDIDKIFRIGGEEFALLLPGADAAAARTAADRVRVAIGGQPLHAGNHDLPVTISGGIAVARDDDGAELLMTAADAALYRAKADGRNRIALEERQPIVRTETES